MEKDFDGWNIQKKELYSKTIAPFYHEREVWWCALGANIGFEQDGSGNEHKRPILILKGLSKETYVAIPLTAATRDHQLRPSVGLVDGKEARALLSQIRVLDSKRLVRKIGYLNQNIFESIRKAIKNLL